MAGAAAVTNLVVAAIAAVHAEISAALPVAAASDIAAATFIVALGTDIADCVVSHAAVAAIAALVAVAISSLLGAHASWLLLRSFLIVFVLV